MLFEKVDTLGFLSWLLVAGSNVTPPLLKGVLSEFLGEGVPLGLLPYYRPIVKLHFKVTWLKRGSLGWLLRPVTRGTLRWILEWLKRGSLG